MTPTCGETLLGLSIRADPNPLAYNVEASAIFVFAFPGDFVFGELTGKVLTCGDDEVRYPACDSRGRSGGIEVAVALAL